jgi:hypothetical protein
MSPLLVEPAPVRQAAEEGGVWSGTTLAPSFSALEADVAAQLGPVRGIERSQLRTDWIAMPSPGIIATISTPAVGTRSSWASGSESDDGTRLSFRSTNPGREVSQPNAVVGLCHGLAPLPARSLRPCPADRWSSRAPPPFHPGRSFPYFTLMLRCLKQHALPLCAISASKP